MSQGWNRQFQNLNRLVNEYAKQITGPGTGFRLGEAGPLRPTAISHRFVPDTTTGTNLVEKLPVKSNLPARIYEVPGYQKGIVYDEIPKIKPVIDYTGKQVGYKLPNGTITSNPEIVKYARQAVSKAKMKALPGIIGKGAGILPTAIPFYKDLAFPVANDLYQGFIMGNPDKSKTLQAILSLSGIDRNGNRVAKEKLNNTSNTGSDNNQLTGGKNVQVNNKSGQPSVQVTRQTASQLASQPTAQPSEQANEQANIQAINDYMQQLKDINQPYVEALQNYLNNYDRLARENYSRNRYWQGIASITGNPNWAKMANDYNPITNEANKVNTIKTLQDAQAGNVNAINEAMGNLAMAQEMGLPPEAAFANKNLLTAMTMRDRNLTNREIAQLNNAIKLQVALQNAQNRLAVQNLRNQGGMTNALIYAGLYGQPAPGLNMQGTPANNQDVGLQQILQNAQKQNNR